MNADFKPQIILVLGMHRSGTSLIAQLIAKYGAYMGSDLMGANEYNEDGYWEYNPLVELHEKFLERTNNKWFAPSEEYSISDLIAEFGNDARQLVEDMDRDGRDWCWKDPRLALFIDFWEEILSGRDVSYVVSYRHPQNSAISLFKRDKLHSSISLVLWELTTNKIFSALSKKKNYFVVDYEKTMIEPEICCSELYRFLCRDLQKEDSPKVVNLMVKAVKNHLNHSNPIPPLSLSPAHSYLIEIYQSGTIPLKFEVSETLQWYLRRILSLYRDFPEIRNNGHYAQLYFDTGLEEFSGQNSLNAEVTGNMGILRFPIVENKKIKRLRFDPLNDFVKVRVISVSLNNNGKTIETVIALTSNALRSENQVYLFDTPDSQIFIDFLQITDIEIDEVVIELEYLQRGVDAVPLILRTMAENISSEQKLNAQFNERIASLNKIVVEDEAKIKEYKALNLSIHSLNTKQAAKIEHLEEIVLSTQKTLLEKQNEIDEIKKHVIHNQILLTNILNRKTYKLLCLLTSPFIWIQSEILLGKSKSGFRKNRFFDEQYYLTNNPDVKESGMSALRHFLLFGRLEGRIPCAEFETVHCVEQCNDVKKSGVNMLGD